MSKLIQCFTFGSCGLHASQRLLIGQGFLAHPFVRFGIPGRPYALSSGAAVQLHDFCAGGVTPPDAVRLLAYGQRMPTEGKRLEYLETYRTTVGPDGAGDEAEIALIELSTPIEPFIGDAIVNLNRIRHCIKDPLSKANIDHRIVSRWGSALSSASEDLKEKADVLLRNWPKDFEDGGLARFGVENLSARRLSVDDMVRDLERLRDRLRKPMALQLYQFRYMPDGRAIEWPARFKAQQIEVARRMGLPTFDLAPLVSGLGAKRLIKDDMFHWRPESWPLQAELTYDFLAGVLGRSGLEAHAEAEDIRREARVAFPEFAAAPGLWLDAATTASTPHLIEAPPFPEAPIGKARAARRVLIDPAPLADRVLDPLAGRLNRELVALHGGLFESLSPETGGFLERYRRLVEHGTLVGEREDRILEVIRSELPAYDVYAVMRPGMGELALLIAASGRKVMAFEPNSHGRAAIEAGVTRLESIGLLAPGALTLFATLTPEQTLDGRGLGIGLKNGFIHGRGSMAAYLEGMARFEALLIDPRRFLDNRGDSATPDPSAESLRSLGFDECRDFPNDHLAWFRGSRLGEVKA